DRLEIILDTWIQSKTVPSPEEVSKEEGIDLPWCKGSRQWPIRIGCFDAKDTIPKYSMLTMQLLRNEDSYFICLETTNRGFARRLQGGILLSLRDGAVTTDIIMGLLQACYIRREVLLSLKKWKLILEADKISEPVLKEWFQLVEDSKRFSELEVKVMDKENILLSEQRKAQPLEKKIQEAGWAVNNILLNDQEKICYSFLDVTKKRT
ncbi:root UVB sensitive, partial [Thalictrum thalictroides]